MLLAPLLFFFAALQPYDVVVRNGHIVDGTGSPWYAADIGIRAGKIAAIGHLEGAPARRSIDVRVLSGWPRMPVAFHACGGVRLMVHVLYTVHGDRGTAGQEDIANILSHGVRQ